MDFFQHKVLITFFFGVFQTPGDLQHIPLDRILLLIHNLNLLWRADNHLAVFNQVDFVQIFQQRRNIRCNEVTAFAQACNQRSIFTKCYYFSRLILRNGGKGIGAFHLIHCCKNCIFQTTLVQYANQLRDDFESVSVLKWIPCSAISHSFSST